MSTRVTSCHRSRKRKTQEWSQVAERERARHRALTLHKGPQAKPVTEGPVDKTCCLWDPRCCLLTGEASPVMNRWLVSLRTWCKDLRRKSVNLASSLELDDGSQGLSRQGSRSRWGKCPNGVCSMDVRPSETVSPPLGCFPLPSPVLSAPCMALRQSFLQVPVCQRKREEGPPAKGTQDSRCQ